MLQKKTPKKHGRLISVSPEAYEIIRKKAFNSIPRRKIREHLNIVNKVPKEA